MQRILLELLAPLQEPKLDQERHADHVTAELLDQPERGGHGPSGREEVIDSQHALAGLKGVFMDRERITAVLKLIFDFYGLSGELPKLPDRDKSSPELM